MVSLAAADKNIHGEHRVPVTCALVGLEAEGKHHGAKSLEAICSFGWTLPLTETTAAASRADGSMALPAGLTSRFPSSSSWPSDHLTHDPGGRGMAGTKKTGKKVRADRRQQCTRSSFLRQVRP
jgi:hypothetical protein